VKSGNRRDGQLRIDLCPVPEIWWNLPVATALFAVDGIPFAPTAVVLETPLGRFITHFGGGDQSTEGRHSDETFRVPSGAVLSRFIRIGWIAELIIGTVQPQLPPHLDIAGCLAAIWRIRATERIPHCRFACCWPAPTAEAEGTPDPGEGLDAFTWHVGRSAISLGTEDGEFLAARAHRGGLIPARLAGELSLGTVEYTATGVVVPFSGLEPSELLQVQFVVAWADRHSSESKASWFAVDQDPAYLLDQLLATEAPTA
jgi:hypothetical protein